MAPPSDNPLDIIIRFSTSNPDLILPIPSPSTTTALSLKQLIRAQLSAPTSESKLRLIHAGRVVPDDGALSKSLHSRVAPPPRDGDGIKSEKALGKRPVREEVVAERVYVHCSIGDVLLPSELREEKKGAEEGDRALREAVESVAAMAQGTETGEAKTTTTPAPRGFDRLLAAGFTSAEVTTLRSQFMAIQSHSHTPDTMPTGADLLALEEQWLDNSNSTGASGSLPVGAVEEDGLDDLLRGSLAGFFWPVGAAFWLMREEGVWSKRRQFSVMAGFAINLTFGFFRFVS